MDIFGAAAGGATCSLAVARVSVSMSALCWRLASARPALAKHDPREDVDREDRERDEECAAPREVLPVVVGRQCELEDDDRQIRQWRIHVRARELVVECGEEQWRRFPRHARHGQEYAGDDA